ncbi:hypothetical protein Spiaf_0896 [Spirochaeta africana DSM 8902]|uniref:Urease accessory protein UreH-like transmembrane domain-containing protein n=2 Tax=Spirochaeta TaxID=146 RepID=H9UHJ2_SPIAZ|nr:hypothetical protein Spiaf_0896 [Spirochaeta africana DSM 8902]
MIWSSFLSGLVLGLGVCSLHCSLILLPMMARLNSDWRGGVQTALLFGIGKVIALSVYGGLAALLGLLVYDLLHHAWISLIAGMVVAAVGVWFLFKSGSCSCSARRGSPLLLGLVDGVVPCAATTGFILFISTQGYSLVSGLLSGMAFGVGTSTGPVLLVSGLAPRVWKRLAGRRHAQLVLRGVGAAVFFAWALLILVGGWV